MKLRGLLLAVLLVGGFWFLTTHLNKGQLQIPFTGHGLSTPLRLSQADAAPAYDAEEQNNMALYKRVLPSVVNITSTTVAFDFFYGRVPQQGLGSGFILDKEGHILTNYHVIADANRIEVTLSDKHRYKATVAGSDKAHDLALLQITAPGLQPATLSDSSNLSVGQKVYAIGNPFGLSGTMTRGIISSIRSIRGNEGAPIENAIQTDASINPGNSGGPLLNSRGEVIGINTMIASNGADQSSGIGFAIPINTAKAVLSDFTRYGRVRRPTMGISSLAIDDPDLAQQMELAADHGVLVQKVVPGGPADHAGLHGGTRRAYLGNTEITLGGDLIMAIDGTDITDTQDIADIMNKHQVGDTVSITFFRGKRQMTIKVTLGEAAQS